MNMICDECDNYIGGWYFPIRIDGELKIFCYHCIYKYGEEKYEL